MKILLALLLSLGLVAAVWAQPAKPKLTHRWFYVGSGLRDQASLERILALFPRAEKAGYNGMMLGGLNPFDRSPEYLENVRRFRETAAKHHIDVYPYVMMHNSGRILAQDPNLAEGLPVREEPFVVKGQEAVLQAEPVLLANGGFEQAEGDRLPGWEMQDHPGQSTFADHAAFHSGGTSLRIEGAEKADQKWGQARVMQRLAVRPFRQYHLSFWAKTDGFGGGANAVVLAPTEKERYLCNLEERVRGTQDWTRYDLLFNSLEWDSLRVYLGVWGGRAGRIWFDDDRRWWWFAIAGFFGALMVTNELPALSLFALLLAALLWKAPKPALLAFVPPAAVVAVAFFGTNWIAHKSLVPAYLHRGGGGESDWYDYDYIRGTPGGTAKEIRSHWINPTGIDAGEPRWPVYAFNVLVGHHGIFSLTPIWLLSIAGVLVWLKNRKDRPLRELALAVGAVGAVCIAFILYKWKTYGNYGGMTSGLRWVFWMAPLWLVVMLPAVDWLAKRAWTRGVALVLLVVSVLSASYPLWNPWSHPWLWDFAQYMGWIAG